MIIYDRERFKREIYTLILSLIGWNISIQRGNRVILTDQKENEMSKFLLMKKVLPPSPRYIALEMGLKVKHKTTTVNSFVSFLYLT